MKIKRKEEFDKPIKEEILDIIKAYFKYLISGFILAFIVTIPYFITTKTEILEQVSLTFLPNIGIVFLLGGVIIFFYYSSIGSGFDAIWTPQIQGEIQRDERERQLSGFPKATAGGLLLISGIMILVLSYFLYNHLS